MKKISLLAAMAAPLLASAQAELHISPGTHLVVSGAPHIVMNQTDWLNDGSFSPGASTVVFTSDAATPRHAIVGGIQPTEFHTLTLQQPAGTTLTLERDARVQHQVVMQTGVLDLGEARLYLAEGGTIEHETPDHHITASGHGQVVHHATLHYPHQVNAGNLGLTLTADAPLGEVVIKRGHQAVQEGGVQSVERYYMISAPQYTGALDAQAQIQYFPAELNGHQPSDLQAWYSADGISWAALAPDGVDALHHRVLISHLNRVDGLTLGSGLPLTPQSPNGVGENGNTLATAFQFDIFPNPAIEGINVKLPAAQADAQAQLLLLDHLGRVVLVGALPLDGTEQQRYFALPHLPVGQYYVQVVSQRNAFELKSLVIGHRK